MSRSIFLLLAAVALSNGCASLSNPVSSGIPLRRLPAEVLNRPRSDMVDVPLTLLRLPDRDDYKLAKGDLLAVIAGDLFGPENAQPPVSVPQPGEGTEATVGYPLPVRDDGTISLPNPKVKPVLVKGLTTEQVEAKLRRILTGEEPQEPGGPLLEIFPKGGAKISVQLMKKRRYRINVVREDTSGVPQNVGGGFSNVARKLGTIISLEAGRNDVLTALNFTGGPPGPDGKAEVIIQRGTYDMNDPFKGITRVPLKIFPDQKLTISEADITLEDGDIIRIPGRDAEVFYTAGILQSRQLPIPRDYDLDIVQAVAIAGGPIINGAFSQNAFVAQSVASGLGTPSPVLVNVLRKLPDGNQINIRIDLARAMKEPRERIYIQANDIIVMQEKPGEAIGRYLTQTLRFNLFQEIFQTSTGTLTTNSTFP